MTGPVAVTRSAWWPWIDLYVPPLALELLKMGFYSIGTVLAFRLGLSAQVRPIKKEKNSPGQY
ncbi:hypothetical protein L915_01228 [Phytophthora nicotianae]|uniref:Uncharacterized protein n=1 Tax=Phytophthora nicotianae TaxID=4792 RepID=W2HN58_PHYNI|nr:hypothetical protein L915_01228 [Phytophthora nicotianae]